MSVLFRTSINKNIFLRLAYPNNICFYTIIPEKNSMSLNRCFIWFSVIFAFHIGTEIQKKNN